MSDLSSEREPVLDQRAARVIQDVVRRRREGEEVLDQDVLRAFPELAAQLEPLLAQAAAVADAAKQAEAAPWLELLDRLEDDSLLGDLEGELASDVSAGSLGAAPPIALATHPIVHAESPPTTPTDVGKRPAGDRPQGHATVDRQPTRLGTPGDDAAPFKPTRRPPQARLLIVDDHQRDGEVYRLRGDVTLIGRTSGDITIPHDPQISSEHASICRERQDDGYRWVLTDLGSRNGVYVRATSACLKDGDVLLLAGHRVRFSSNASDGRCTLEEIGDDSSADRVVLEPGSDCWLGRDATVCANLLRAAPQLSRRHARLRCDDGGRWRIEDNKTTNGVWILVDEIELADRVAFQLGEQRFFFEAD